MIIALFKIISFTVEEPLSIQDTRYMQIKTLVPWFGIPVNISFTKYILDISLEKTTKIFIFIFFFRDNPILCVRHQV